MISRLSNFSGPLSSFSKELPDIPGSMEFTPDSYLYGSSDTYSVGDSEFTVEVWFKSYDTSGYRGIISNRQFPGVDGFSINISSGSVEFYTIGGYYDTPISQDVWYHAAISNSGGTSRFYLNGVRVFALSDDNVYGGTAISIGRYYSNYDGYYFDGIISNIRYDIGHSLYNSDFTPPTGSLDSNPGFTRVLINPTSVPPFWKNSVGEDFEKNGSVVFTQDIPFLGGSFRFGINGDMTPRFISFDSSSDWAFGTSSFCIEWFQYQTLSDPPPFSRVFEVGSWPNHSISVSIESGTLLLWINAGNTYYASYAMTDYLDRWVHLAVSRDSNYSVSIWKDGIRVWTGNVPNSVTDSSSPLMIGYGSDNVWNGYLTNFRFVTDNPVYDVDQPSISVPTSPLGVVDGTKLLLLASSPGEIIDSSTYSRVGYWNSATWSSMSPF
jgi:hypothetical protein